MEGGASTCRPRARCAVTTRDGTVPDGRCARAASSQTTTEWGEKLNESTKHGRRRLSLIMGGLAVLPLAMGTLTSVAQSAGATPVTTGTLEVCKSGANGMAGTNFVFSVSGLAAGTVTVKGGQCSGPLTVNAGHNTITETAANLPAGDRVSKVAVSPPKRAISRDLATRSVVVAVPSGTTVTDETIATFTNIVPPGTLKVCKISANPTLQGSMFTFTVNGGAPFSIAAGTPTSPVCSSITRYPVGTVVQIAESPTPNVHVKGVKSNNSSLTSNLTAGTSSVTVMPGHTVVTYNNAVNPIPQTGYIEVCKDASDSYVSGNFSFGITAPGFTRTASVPVGECTPPIQIPAGNVNISETARSPYSLDRVSSIPSSALVSQNDTNGTAVVSVPVSSTTANETQVHFVNDTQMSQLKVCKALTANSSALAGQTFSFLIQEHFASTTGASTTQTLPVTAGSAGGTLCSILPNALPIGTVVTVSESIPSGADYAAVSGNPTTLTIGAGANVATVTNEALGTIEVCKQVASGTAAPSMSVPFTVTDNDGVAHSLSVPVGQCSLPLTVPAGTATVTEGAVANYHLASVTGNDSTLVSTSGNSATFNVAAGGVSTETVATFYNAVNQASFKVCKLATAGSGTLLNNTGFKIGYSWTVNGTAGGGSVTLMPNQCSGIIGPLPVVNANGTPVVVTTTEAPSAVSNVAQIVIDPSANQVSNNSSTGTASFNLGSADGGMTAVTYWNQAVLPGAGV